jgi:hypothetical protein
VYEPGYRQFLCARCRTVVRLCLFCDRGNIYCSKECSLIRRIASVRRSRRRYQATPEGRANNAKRQRRLRRRRRDVTDHGSPPGTTSSSLATPVPESPPERTKEVIHGSLPAISVRAPRSFRKLRYSRRELVACDSCGRLCLPFARIDPVRRRRRDVLRRFGLL